MMQIHTWADAFGNWHCQVTEEGVGNADMARAVAFAAIICELKARGEVDEDAVILDSHTTSMFGGLSTEFFEPAGD